MGKVSVITIVKDNLIGLRNTHESLLRQSFSDWEMIIVVGDSSDGTLTFARTLQREDSRICLIEQKGVGIYEAMNDGLCIAVGYYTWFMNAGDQFSSETVLWRAVNEISKDNFGLVIGSHKIQGSTQNFSNRYPAGKVSAVNFAFNRGAGCHQAMIFRTTILKEIGGFNVSYLLASDFDLVIRLLKASPATRVPDVYADIEPGGIADRNIYQVHREKHQIRVRLLGGVSILIASSIWTFLAGSKIFLRNRLS